MAEVEVCFIWKDGADDCIRGWARWWAPWGIDKVGRGGRGWVVCEGRGSEECLAWNGSELMDNALRKEGPRLDCLFLLSAALFMNS